MVSAKEFAQWLRHRFHSAGAGVYLTRADINQLTGRQSFNVNYIHDIHHELMQDGIAFVTDTSRELFYLVPISRSYWRDELEQQFERELFCNVLPIPTQAVGR
ncbi:hypothetical protein VST7929_01270 [Vibrio stylophorae]|uniref:Uncharacterized protein n=1 Tax=Vibrio stylophorae TaxID=659351 RepID=A0ABN8DT15_9VIBR|nr:hypothetical protein [Vibrio stylophorae]CAH0533404.1 hypothetical protein VST7929_01270 [Vibrio stylophorae]